MENRDALSRQLIATEHEIKHTFYTTTLENIKAVARINAARHNQSVKALEFPDTYLIHLPGMNRANDIARVV